MSVTSTPSTLRASLGIALQYIAVATAHVEHTLACEVRIFV